MIYEYKCSKCGKIEDRLVSSSTENTQMCKCENDAPMIKEDKVYNTSFTLKGPGWYKSGGY